jgi:dTDP-4-amino-4,6-dideoxygalactose transaminase
LKNFGFADEVTVMAPGINGKMNEFQAALGMLQLTRVVEAIAKREALDRLYERGLAGVRGVSLLRPPPGTQHNYAYLPILVEPDYPISRDELYARFRKEDILVRRYFYPLISDLPMYRGLPSANPSQLPVAKSVSERILCLPIFPALEADDVARVIDIIANP